MSMPSSETVTNSEVVSILRTLRDALGEYLEETDGLLPKRDDGAKHVSVEGAGEIQLGPISKTGSTIGISFRVSWGKYGYAGGVLSAKDLPKLVEILKEFQYDLEYLNLSAKR